MQTVEAYVVGASVPEEDDVQFGYTELVYLVRAELDWGKEKPSRSTISRWMSKVLKCGAYDPSNPRMYSVADARSLVDWGRAGSLAKRGSKADRLIRRTKFFLEFQKAWQPNPQKN